MQIVLSCCWKKLRITKKCIYEVVLREKIIIIMLKNYYFLKENYRSLFAVFASLASVFNASSLGETILGGP